MKRLQSRLMTVKFRWLCKVQSMIENAIKPAGMVSHQHQNGYRLMKELPMAFIIDWDFSVIMIFLIQPQPVDTLCRGFATLDPLTLFSYRGNTSKGKLFNITSFQAPIQLHNRKCFTLSSWKNRNFNLKRFTLVSKK